MSDAQVPSDELLSELKRLRMLAAEVECALHNRIRSERAFNKFAGMAESLRLGLTKIIGDGDDE